MENRTDISLDKVVYISTIYHIPDSRINVLNGYIFVLDCVTLEISNKTGMKPSSLWNLP